MKTIEQLSAIELVQRLRQHLYAVEVLKSELTSRAIEEHITVGSDLARDAYATTVHTILEAMNKK